MKVFFKSIFILPGVLVLALAATGCATHQPNKPGQQALVCPNCKMVQFTTVNPAPFGRRWAYAYPTTTTTTQMQCPNCQGALKTLFKEGKLQHKCSVCQQEAFTCPVDHRW